MSDFELIATQAMKSVWNRNHRPFQLKSVSHTTLMRFNLNNTEAMSLGQSTGAVK